MYTSFDKSSEKGEKSAPKAEESEYWDDESFYNKGKYFNCTPASLAKLFVILTILKHCNIIVAE